MGYTLLLCFSVFFTISYTAPSTEAANPFLLPVEYDLIILLYIRCLL